MHKILTPRMVDWIKEKYNEGYFMHEIAEALYVSKDTVAKELKGFEKVQKPKLIYDGSDKELFIKEKIYDGYTQVEVAEALGTYQMAIWHFCKKHQLKVKPKARLVYDFTKK